ncbi:MAG: TonB-dependent receptor [Opitutaceae bacterium]|nr:TonB-dependent receptor [Opitutaceae bacterium]
MNSLPLRHGILFAALLVFTGLTRAQTPSAGMGGITGRIFNPATGEYVRNAEVRIDGTAQVAVSEDGGYYRLTSVPAGDVTLVASYLGYESVTARVTINPGATTTRDFELAGAGARPAAGEVVTLGAFLVEAEQEGQAKAISEQRQAMNVKTVVASDNFGDIAEGNIGEFLKFMPGITLDYVETDTRAARMGGMEPRYGNVTLDGGTLANSTATGFGGDTRQFEFEAVTINNIESIEVYKTLSADMPADAPAGSINLRSKSALDRKGARFNTMLGAIGNEYEFTVHRTPRHDDSAHAKIRPTATFDYSNAFFGQKLGIAVNGLFTNVFKPQFRVTNTHDYTSAQANNAGTPLINLINYKDGPKMTDKSSGGLKLDYQPFTSLRLSLASSYTYFKDEIANRNLGFRVSAANIAPGSTLSRIVALPTANANTRLEHTNVHSGRKFDTTNLSLGFTYKQGRLTADGLASYSRSRAQNGADHIGAVDQANLWLTRTGWIAERPGVASPSWNLTQTPGLDGVLRDWYNLDNFGRNDPTPGNIVLMRQRGKTEQYVGQINARYAMAWERPTFFKAGMYDQVTTRRKENVKQFTATYVGPDNNQLNAPLPVSIADFRIAEPWGSNIGRLPVPDKAAMRGRLIDHPTWFTQTEAQRAANLDSLLGSPQSNQEQIRAAYVMQNTRSGAWQWQGGLRYEETSTRSRVKSPLPISRNRFANVTVNPNTGVRTYTAAQTAPYIEEKWSRGFSTDYGDYHDVLASAAAKYTATKNLNFKFGYHEAIKRPPLNNIAGQWSINAADTIITIPNPDLTPERSRKFSALAEYFIHPAGTVSVHVFQTSMKGAVDRSEPMPASALGLGDDPVYGFYEFITFENVPGTRKIKGIELSYSQQLTFLKGEVFRGASVFGSYSRFTSTPKPGGFVPQNAAAGVSWRFRRFNANLSGTWTDEFITGANYVSANSRYFPGEPEYLADRFIFDFGAGYRVGRHTTVFVSGRNIANSGKTWFYKADGRIRQMERYGGQWTLGVKGGY